MAICEISELKKHLPSGKRLLGLDLGTKTIGLALSDAMLMIATPMETISRKKFTADAQRLGQIIREQDVGGLVIGLPVNMDGSEGARCQSSRHFADNLLRKPELVGDDLPIAFWDERLSTSAVQRVLVDEADVSRKKQSAAVDKMAAAWILQGVLDHLSHG